jgi:uncharacterized protein (TIGR02646 family)
MIRVRKPVAPAMLLDRGAVATKELCAAYERRVEPPAFDASIYAHPSVKDALRQAQHRKCAFCESFFDHTGYGDVEHFRPKAGYKQRDSDQLRQPGYYWLAYAWDNLFYSCQLCNQRFKRNLFPLKDGRRRARSHTHGLDKEEPLLVDPSRLDAAAFIGFHEEQAYALGGCPEGKTTIEVLGLNRSELAEARGRSLKVLRWLVVTQDLLRQAIVADPKPELTDQLRALEQALRDSTEDSGEYAAMARAFFGDVPSTGLGLGQSAS